MLELFRQNEKHLGSFLKGFQFLEIILDPKVRFLLQVFQDTWHNGLRKNIDLLLKSLNSINYY